MRPDTNTPVQNHTITHISHRSGIEPVVKSNDGYTKNIFQTQHSKSWRRPWDKITTVYSTINSSLFPPRPRQHSFDPLGEHIPPSRRSWQRCLHISSPSLPSLHQAQTYQYRITLVHTYQTYCIRPIRKLNGVYTKYIIKTQYSK